MSRVSLCVVVLALSACSFDPRTPRLDPPVESRCGDGKVEGDEVCDDGNRQVLDGCFECVREPGWDCDDQSPTVCFNPAPTALDDVLEVEINTTGEAPVLDNDTDPRDEVLRIDSIGPANFGSVRIEADKIIYDAGGNTGRDVIDYVVADPAGGTDTGRLTVFVGVPNRAPMAEDITVSVPKDMTTAIELKGTDLDGQNLTYSLVTQPQSGTTVLTDDVVLYSPNANYEGADTFTYVASDHALDSPVATVTIQVGEGWWNAAWGRRRLVEVDSNGIPALTDVPVRVPLDTAGLLADGASSDGSDLRFVSLDGLTVYPHDLVAWNTPHACAWVSVPIEDALTSNFWLYFGNAAAVDDFSPDVFEQGYEVVYHLEGDFYDAVRGQVRSTDGDFVDAIAGRGLAIGNNSDETIPLVGRPSLGDGALCSWLMLLQSGGNRQLWLMERDSSGQGSGAELRLIQRTDGRLGVRFVTGNTISLDSGAVVADDDWHWVCVAWGGGRLRLIVDGVEAADGPGFEGFDVQSLKFSEYTDPNFHGPVDEIWMLDGARTDAWLLAQYRLLITEKVTVSTTSETP